MRFPYDLDEFFQIGDQSIIFLYEKCKEKLGEEKAEEIRLFVVSPKNQPEHNCDIYRFYNKLKSKVQDLIPLTYWQAWKAIMHDVNTKYGAPMGRPNVGGAPDGYTKVYQRRVSLPYDGAYDRGGAYWGYGKPLYVRFTLDLSYVEFFRA